jgi:hypothetical protein
VFSYLSNEDVFACCCRSEERGIAVGILAIKTKKVFGQPQTLYAESGKSCKVQIPNNPQEFNELLPYAFNQSTF